jgi:hypothetical protein
MAGRVARSMQRMIAYLFIVCGLASGAAHAQFGVPWQRTPKITIVSPAGDSRLPLADEAVDFWNKALEGMGSGFRLGPVMRVVQTMPEEALQSLSLSVVDQAGARASVPQVFRDLPGDLTIFLAQSEFVSFTGPFDSSSKRVVGIRGTAFPPINLPNVARNVIAHELGHAIGLGHNSDPAMLMCGRPAPCRPGLFRSDVPRMFPLTEDEKRRLLTMYPPAWKSQSR